LSDQNRKNFSGPKIIGYDSHKVKQTKVSNHALNIYKKLKESGFEAYLVGGCIRDILLNKTPKDFDVSTNATPDQVLSLFKRSRLVGRRFQIVHVRFGRSELVEVSTFRKSGIETSDDEHMQRSEDGLILRDNVFGTIEEDAFRRDFTINALYYDPQTKKILDYVGGFNDLKKGQLRCIGDPSIRLAEDPVRALRALRFKAKLKLSLHQSITQELPKIADKLSSIPAARLFDEIQKMLLNGFGSRAWTLLKQTPLQNILFPLTEPNDKFVIKALQNTDMRVLNNQPVTIGFLLAVFLWKDYLTQLSMQTKEKRLHASKVDAAIKTLRTQQEIIAIPRRFSTFITEIWRLQPRLEARRKKDIEKLLGHRRFRAAYDFLMLRKEIDVDLKVAQSADWWTNKQQDQTSLKTR
tara:strand:- start:2573 stop:3799 length:1227 start_codon:yes stop_codon:yes gene_type:complete